MWSWEHSLVNDLDCWYVVMSALGPVPQMMQPFQVEEEITGCRCVHELQLSLLLVFLDHFVACSHKDIVLLLLI